MATPSSRGPDVLRSGGIYRSAHEWVQKKSRTYSDESLDFIADRFEYWNSHPGSAEGIDIYESCLTWPQDGSPVTNPVLEDQMSKRLFSLSNREVNALMDAWGFTWERVTGGHAVYIDGATGQRVQVMAPDRSSTGSGEKGNAIGMKKAARIRGLSIRQFLAGPVKEKQPQPQPEVVVEIIESKEQDMTNKRRGRPQVVGGLADHMRGVIADHKGEVLTAGEIAMLVREAWPNQHGEVTARDLSGILASWVVSPNQPLEKVGPGQFRYIDPEQKRLIAEERAIEDETRRALKPTKFRDLEFKGAEEPLVLPSTDERAAEIPSTPEPPTPPTTVNVGPVTVGTPLVSNGLMPEMLAKVATLDGGKTLFQGDDGALYVIASARRLEI